MTTNPFHNFHTPSPTSQLVKPQYHRYSSSPQQSHSILSTSPSTYAQHNFYRNERTTQSLTSYTSSSPNANKSQIPKFQHQVYQQQQHHQTQHQTPPPQQQPLPKHHQSPNLSTLGRPSPNGSDKLYQFYDGGGEGMASGFLEQPNIGFKDGSQTFYATDGSQGDLKLSSSNGMGGATMGKSTAKREEIIEDLEIGTDDRGMLNFFSLHLHF